MCKMITQIFILFFLLPCVVIASEAIKKSHGYALFDDLKYPASFKNFDYVNPKAPKKGTLRMMAVGAFNSFNPFIVKGNQAAGLDLVYDSLMVPSFDEPNSEYGLIAKMIKYPKDYSWVMFTLRKEARFQDGKPITAEDVAFSFNLLKQKGLPTFRSYYNAVDSVKVLSTNKVLFNFKNTGSRELVYLLGQLSVLPKHYWEGRLNQFSQSSLVIPVGSGPYAIDSFEAGRSITYRRQANYWAKNLPVNTGLYNFDKIRYEYYIDPSVSFEAFKHGDYDFIFAVNGKKSLTYSQKIKNKKSKIVQERVVSLKPAGMQGFVFNIRRPIFQDRRVRQALSLLFDFEWTNKALLHSAYQRTQSYFSHSEFAATGLPSKAELKLLNPFKDQLPYELFNSVYRAPKTDGTGNLKKQIRQAYSLLKQAGWSLKNNRLVDSKGRPFRFQILLFGQGSEQTVLPFKKNLARLGIQMEIRFIDVTQYMQRMNQFDYDMIEVNFSVPNTPGSEQKLYWGSQSAVTEGSSNYIGIKNPVVDKLVENMIQAKTRTNSIAAARALDRVLLWGYYVIPKWHTNFFSVAYWDYLQHPQVTANYQFSINTWWIK